MAASAPKAPPQAESTFLWSTWSQAGHGALERGDYLTAVKWLCEAQRQLCAGGPNDRQLAVTQSALSFARFRLAERYDACAANPCVSKSRRKRLRALAAKERKAAYACAALVLKRLRPDPRNAAISIAYARAAFVAAKSCLAAADFSEAARCFAAAIKALEPIESQAALINASLQGQFEVGYRSGDYKLAYAAVVRLRQRVGARADERALATWLIACEADLLLLMGRYREADNLYERWRNLFSTLDAAAQCSAQAAYGFAVFGRSRLKLGYYDDAGACLASSRQILSSLRTQELLVKVDVLLAMADRAQRMGDFPCAHILLGEAELALVQAELRHKQRVGSRRLQLCQLRGERWLAMGQFEQARPCFEEAECLARQDCPCNYMLLVPALLGLAHIECERSCIDQALAHVNSALECLQQAGASATAEMAHTLHQLARVYLQRGSLAEAQPPCESAIWTLRAALRADHPEEARMRLSLAEALSGKHQAERALGEARASRDMLQRYVPQRAFDVARCLRVEAEIMHSQRDFDCALWTLLCAMKIWQEPEVSLQIRHPERALITLGMALIHVHRGEPQLIDQILRAGDFHDCMLRYKGAEDRVGFELNRRGNLFFEHGLFNEARWLYDLAAEHYELGCGPTHRATLAARDHEKSATARMAEPPEDYQCACSPYYRDCALIAPIDDPCPCPTLCCW
jgi:tetratricopeptide (TPR) repeat protein